MAYKVENQSDQPITKSVEAIVTTSQSSTPDSANKDSVRRKSSISKEVKSTPKRSKTSNKNLVAQVSSKKLIAKQESSLSPVESSNISGLCDQASALAEADSSSEPCAQTSLTAISQEKVQLIVVNIEVLKSQSHRKMITFEI